MSYTSAKISYKPLPPVQLKGKAEVHHTAASSRKTRPIPQHPRRAPRIPTHAHTHSRALTHSTPLHAHACPHAHPRTPQAMALYAPTAELAGDEEAEVCISRIQP